MKNFSGTSLLVTAVLTAGFTTTAMGQVANDECSGAIAVSANTPTQFDTTAATASADAAPVDTFCTGTFLDWGTGTNKDVWFTFTPAESGLADFSTCFAGGFDTSMVLYTGSCGALTQVGCNGDAPADAACQQFFSKISAFAVTAGTTYTIRVGGWNGVEFGIAALTVTLTPTGAGCPGTESCGTVHATPGCSDATCCTNVCAANPLCCDIGWDATCVSTAIQLCGIYVHQCITPAAPNDCAPNATVFSGDSSFSIANTGYNTDGPNHPATTCSSGNDVFLNDVWYRAQAQANGTLRVYTCNSSTFDTKVAVYNMGTNPAAFNYDTMNQATVLVGCNDDGSADCQVGATFASDLSVSVVQGNWYLIRCGTYDFPGTCTLFVNMPEPCALPAQTGVEAEACGSATNNGCNATGQTETVTLGSRTKGTFATFTDPVSGANTRDTDFYRLDITSDVTVTMNVYSASFVTGLILGGDVTVAGCTAVTVLGTTSGNCPSTGSVCLNPGTYYVFVAPGTFTGLPCGSGVFNEYVLELTSAPATCPDTLDQVCADPGANTYVSSTAAAGGGLVACGVNPAFPNCGTGGTTVNSFARPMPLGAVGGSITCLDFGVFSVRRAANATNTACANFASDIPLPATIGIYADIDGGAPRNKIVTAGDGNDLQLLDAREVLIPGGAYVANLDFNPPLCIQNAPAGSNIVVVMDCPDLYTAGATPSIPDASGYGIRAGGGTVTGQGSGTYVRLSCADAAGAYVIAESLGATFTAQWIVTFKGNFAGCAAPCPTDINGDGTTGSADLASLLNGWGTSSPDLNGDGTVGAADLSTLLGAWGACP
jgi:hypothetical protein